jgi:D-alanyl-D-alanine dipeptidase
MFSKFCSDIEKANRAILRKAMLNTGFYFYPGEWWHYSYGDQSWAVYIGKTPAIYGEKTLST